MAWACALILLSLILSVEVFRLIREEQDRAVKKEKERKIASENALKDDIYRFGIYGVTKNGEKPKKKA